MQKLLDFKKSGGRLELFTNDKVFLVKPSGIINPVLVKKDLEMAYEYGLKHHNWLYVVDTTNVLFPNPFNLLFLKEINKLPNREAYFIYAPSVIVRFLARITNFIIKPDKVIKDRSNFEYCLNSF